MGGYDRTSTRALEPDSVEEHGGLRQRGGTEGLQALWGGGGDSGAWDVLER